MPASQPFAAAGRLRRAVSLRTATALAGGLLATFALAAPAMGQATQGGAGGQGNASGAPVGGVTSVTGAGGAGSNAAESYEGAAGGGAGVTGGKGGDAFNGVLGGAGGAAAGASGGDGLGGGIGSRASGGGGGAHGAYLSGAPGTSVAGGNGGAGGSSADGDGGGGGAGGYGAVTTGTGAMIFDHATTGGNGGAGGAGYFYGGSGGAGGHGLVLTGTGAVLAINGAITGGNGGAAGNFVAGCCAVGSNGAGGIGLVGGDVDIVLNAAIIGGLAGNGVTRALAMQLGGSSTIELASGWGLIGGIEIAGTALEFVLGNDQNLSNAISGTGKLVKSGIGNLTLGGTNSYAGGTEISGGTLTIGSVNALGSGNVTLANGGTLDIGNASYNLSRTITGTGTVTASGTGRLTIGAGALAFGSVGGAITSALPLTVGSASTLTLYGNNSLTGGINLSGRLEIRESGAAGGSDNTITTSGSVISYANGVDSGAAIQIASDTTQLEVLGTDSATQSGVISEDVPGRGFAKIGGGTLILSAANSYSGGTDVLEGTLGLGADTAAGTGRIFLADGTRLLSAVCGCAMLTIGNDIEIASGGVATIDTDGYDTLITGPITGGDAIFADTFGGGLVVLTGTNTYGATTIESNAALQVGDGGTVGTLGTGNVLNDGVLVFDRSDDLSFSHEISGAGLLVQAGDGELTLTGTNSYTGGTVIDAGTLRVGDGWTVGTLGTGDIDNYGILIFDRSDDITVADDIYGSGDITKLGAGTLTLSGFNSYTGTTSVQGGTLAITEFALGSSQLTELGNGARLLALEDTYVGDMRILPTGGTIDTDTFTIEVFGGVDFQGLLTKTGTGTLILTDIFETGDGNGGIDVTAGTLGLGSDFAAGTGTIRLADGTTLLNASCFCGDLTVDNDIEIALGGTASFNAAGQSLSVDPTPTTVTINGNISGGNFRFFSPDYVEGAMSTAQPAVFVLNGTNSYGQTLIAPNIALIIEDGTLGTGDVVFEGGPSDPASPAALVFANSADYTFGGAIVGAGLVAVQTFDPATKITLSGSNTPGANFTGTVEVASGHLVVDGDFGDVIGNTATMLLEDCGCGLDATLGGSGTFHGNVELRTATLAPGNSPGTLNIAGDLTLGAGTILNYELGATGTPGGLNNDLVAVGGNLTLDGTLNTIAWGAGYGPGYYRLFSYGGTLTDNGINAGSIADGLSASVLTNIAGQVNVLLGTQVVQYWDGGDTTGSSPAADGDGGNGTWNAAGTNWTAGTGFGINDQWRATVGVFAGTAGGTVTVEGTQAFQELRFATDDYLLRPLDAAAGLQTTGGFSVVDVSAGLAADIGVVIQGAAGLTKTGTGTLLLSAVNTYTGATTVSTGTLRLGIGDAINTQSALDVAAGATFDLDGFNTPAGSLSGAGVVTLNGGRLDTGYDNSSTTFSGTVTGDDDNSVFTKNGGGTLTLAGTIDLASTPGLTNFLQVNAGTLAVTATGGITTDLLQNFSTLTNAGTLTIGTVLQSFATFTNTGTIVGTTQNFATFDNNGGTMGSLQSLGGTATNSGTINGSVQTFASFTSTGIINGSLSNFATALVENQVNGEIANLQAGATVTLTGTTTGITNYYGATGSLFDLANFSTTIGALNGNGGTIEIGTATLTIDSLVPSADFSGTISGSGPVIKTGGGEQILHGVHTYTGLTTVSGGTLTIADTGSLAGAVLNSATLNNAGTLAAGAVNTGTFASTGTIAVGLQTSGTASLAGAINGFLTNSGTATLIGALSGITTFTQTAAGALDLSSYAMTAETLSGAGTIQGTGGSLTLTGNASSTFSGTFSGTADLTKNGTGTLTLTGDSTRAGTTTIDAGTLQIGTGGATGALGSGAIVNDGALVVDRTGTLTVDGPISGTGTLAKAGSGTLVLLGDNGYSGTTTISGGTLQIGDGGATGTLGSGAVTNDGTLAFNRSGAVFVGNDIGGSGNLIKSGSGTLVLTGNNAYAGTTTISAGTLTIGAGIGGTSGSLGAGTVFNDGVLEFDRGDPITVANTITGSGVVRVPGGSGDVTLTAANSYTGGTQVMGTLRLGHDTAAGTGRIDLAGTLYSTLSFDTLTLANDIQLEQLMPASLVGADFGVMVLNGSISGGDAHFGGSGAPTTFHLNGVNSYEDTYIGAATSVVMNGTLGTGDVVLAASGSTPSEVYFRNDGDYTIAGTISGDGNVWFSGSSGTTTTLSGSNTSAANFTGTVRLNTGNLVINGDFGDVVGNSADLVFFPNAFDPQPTLGGSGTFHGNVDALAGGIIAPGNSPGTLTIAGNLALGAGTVLNFELGESGTPGGASNDLIVVGGDLTLDGTLNTIAFGPGYGPGYYRLFDYAGALTDNGLAIGTIDGGLSASVLTNIAGQVNVALGPQLIQYWDDGDMTGASAAANGDGGDGVWNSGNTNWTSAAGFGINDQWRSLIGVFAGSAASNNVTIEGTQSFQELRFETDGYVLTGATVGEGLATTGSFSVIDVASGLEAEIGAAISGSGGLTKTGAGTLTLGGINTYTGLTMIAEGAVSLSLGGTLAGDVLNNATFSTSGSISGDLTNNGAVFAEGVLGGSIVNEGSISLTGYLAGVLDLTQGVDGSLALNGNSFSIRTLAGAGTIDLGGATLYTDSASDSQFNGALAGSGTLGKSGSGTLMLGGDSTADLVIFEGTLILTGSTTLNVVNTAGFRNDGVVGGSLLNHVGGTAVNTGTVGFVDNYGALTSSGTVDGGLVNQGGATAVNTGTIVGDLFNASGGAFASTGTISGNFENYGSASIEGQLNGAVTNVGDIVLTGTTVGIGLVNHRLGNALFDLNGFDTAFGSLTGDGEVRLGTALLTVGGDGSNSQFDGIITGTGGVTKTGSGLLWLTGANTYAGLTTISDGMLVLATGGMLAGNVQNDAEFESQGTVTGLLTNSGQARNEGRVDGGANNSGTLETVGVITGNLANTGSVFAESELNGAVDNRGYFTVTGALSGVTAFVQDANGYTVLRDVDLTTDTLQGAGAIELGSGTWTTGGANGSFEWAGEMWGTGGLTKVGAGTMTVSGVNTFTGTTTVSAGALVNTGSLAGPVVNSATFASTGTVAGSLTNSGTASLAGQLDGAIANSGSIELTGITTGIGAVSQTAAGIFALNGFSTTIGSLAGDGRVELGGARLTAGGDNASTEFAGVIVGSGGLTKLGTGTLTLSGINTHTGATNVGAGALINAGAIAGPVVNLATFASTGTITGSLANSGTASLAGQLNGAIANSGALGLTGATTGIGAVTQTGEGTFALNGFDTTIGSLAGAGQVQLGGATLTTGGDNGSTAFAGVVSGSGALIKAGTGTLVLGGANTFTGITTIAGGVLQLGDGGTTGSLASSSIVDNGVLAINRSDLLQLSAAISGTGGLLQAGTGTTHLTGANTYTGGTLVDAGRLVGNTTSLQGAIQTNAVLEFAQAGAGTYAGSLYGTGAFEKTGAGLLNLTGDSSSFTGVTHVLGGQLAVNGLLSRSVVTVGPGATLMGLGPIGGLVAQSGAIVAPGNSVGTLRVDGSVQLLAGSTYRAEITSAAADLIDATGTAQIAGTLSVVNLGGTYTLGTTYVIVNAAGGRTGTFEATSGLNSFGPRLRARVVYTPTQVQLLMDSNLLANLACSSPTSNQASFIAAFDDAVQNGGYDPQTLAAVYDLDPAGVCGAVDRLSGGVYPALASVALEEERLIREAAVDRLRFTQDAEAVDTGAWAQLVGSWGHVNGEGTGFDVDHDREGAIFGVDTGGAGWRVGIYGHHMETELDADALVSEARLERNGAGAYAGFASGSFRARLGASYSDLEFSTTRSIDFPGFGASAQGAGDGSMVQGFGEVAYRFDVGNETFLEPFADLALASVDLDAVDETGSAASQLRVAGQEHDVGRAIAGLRGDAAIQRGSTRLRLGIDAGLQHNFGDRSIAALIALDGAPQHPFTVRATEFEPWAFVGGGRVAIDFGSNVTATLSYRGVLAGTRNDHAAAGTLSVRF